jgi:hypothetical protein
MEVGVLLASGGRGFVRVHATFYDTRISVFCSDAVNRARKRLRGGWDAGRLEQEQK